MADTENPNPSPVAVNERLLIEQLGIPLKKIRALRPADVAYYADGVFWTPAAAQALAVSVGGTLTLPEKNAPPIEAEEMTVVSTPRGADGRHFANPNVIQCRRKNGALVYVQVKFSKNFRTLLRSLVVGKPPHEPMVIKAVPPNGGVNWRIVGREPAHPAQW